MSQPAALLASPAATGGARHVKRRREARRKTKAARLTRRRLAAATGSAELADKILSEWGGHRLPEKPSEKELARRERDRRIREELSERGGDSYREIARRHGLSPSRIAQIGKESG